MTLQQDLDKHIDQLATETLKKFESVADAARSKLGTASGATATSLATINTMTDGGAVNRLAQIGDELRQSYVQLSKEPAISRVVVESEDGQRHTYFICRTTSILGMASYRSPVGRLASLPVGSDLDIPVRGNVVVIERAQLHPEQKIAGWDSNNSIIQGQDYGPLTVVSFRTLLEGEVDDSDVGADLLASLLAQESQSANKTDGIRRNVITKMGLRDQPILDQYQDEIFRLPLGSRLLILGPPGTGKTTTLIRRLGQKLDSAFLDEDERRIVESVSSDNLLHNQSWLMFTPTDLLKLYVKEAFAREGIPAPEERITTWTDYRHKLAREKLGVLRTASPGGTFVLKYSLHAITPDAQVNMIAWFDDFNAWHKSAFIEDIRVSADGLSNDPDGKIAELGKRLLTITQVNKSGSITTLFTSINAESIRIQDVIAELKSATDKKVRESITLQLNRNKLFLNELGVFIDGLQDASNADTDIEDADDLDNDEDEELNQSKTPMAKALATYNQVVRSQARSVAKKRSIGKNTRTGRIIEWIGERTLSETDRSFVGASLLIQARARRFINPVKKYIGGLPKRYRAFRRARQDENKWYIKDAYSATDINTLELDIVLLAILRSAGELLNVASIMRNIDSPAWASLQPIHDLYKNQVLVDEATDFSPIQIACMAAMSHPRFRSFFACGDFNQRLTTWGSRSLADMKWVFPDFEIREIKVSYRQSRQLNELANALIHLVDQNDSGVILPSNINNEGVPPVLVEESLDHSKVVNWLANRIKEVSASFPTLPTIAILVNSEDEVQHVADDLNTILQDASIRVVACPKGQFIGQDSDVRVFDVRHIKGLEFEAVFFVGIDRLALMHPELFDKYLYVGSTRAATYLGVTCETKLPASIEAIRPLFVESW